MEKADKAIALAIDNAARIESTARLLRSHLRGSATIMEGTMGAGITVFGDVKAGSIVIVSFTGDPVSLKLRGNTIMHSSSPLLAVIEKDGDIALNEEREDAFAMVMNG